MSGEEPAAQLETPSPPAKPKRRPRRNARLAAARRIVRLRVESKQRARLEPAGQGEPPPELSPLHPRQITTEELIRLCWPTTLGSWLVGVDAGGFTNIEAPFRFLPVRGAWVQLGPWGPGEEPELVRDFAARPVPIGVLAVPRLQPDYCATMAASPILWASLPLPRQARQNQEPLPRRDAADVGRALARLAALPIPPSIVTDRGGSVQAIWRLAQPVADEVQLGKWLWAVAAALGEADRFDAVDPRGGIVWLPDRPFFDVFPVAEMQSMLWTEAAVPLEALSAWLEAAPTRPA